MTSPASLPHRFDSNRAWLDAVAAIKANRDMLAALAGVFVTLPTFALLLLLPPPQAEQGATPEATLEMLGAYFNGAWPAYALVLLFHTAGIMAMLALLSPARRATVGEAIRTGLASTPIAILAQLIQGLAMIVAVMVPGVLLALSGSAALAMLGTVIGIGLSFYVWGRTTLAHPIIAIEGVRNPVTAVLRSFGLTRGSTWAVPLFLVMLLVAGMIAAQVAEVAFGLAAMAIGGAEAAKLIGALVAALLQSALTIVLVAALAASHRQLTGGNGTGVATPAD